LGSLAQPHPLQQSFIDQQAAQCAGCMNGMIMGAFGWLQARFSSGNRTVPTDDEVKNFLSGVGQNPAFVYLCRCGAHLRIVRGIQQAAQELS
jgi:aerobic-type carbon monoxide dehydrogenase small subunit (CoxS/CutS family)